MLLRGLLVGLLLALLAACDAPQPTAVATPEPAAATTAPEPTPEPAAITANLRDGCVETYDPEVNYFPEQLTVEDAVGFTVEYFANYKLVTLPTPFAGAAEPAQYVLVQCGTPAPEGYPAATVIELPVTRFVALSTTYLPPLVAWDLLDRLVAIDTGQFVNAPEVQALLTAGTLAEVGTGSEINVETAIELEPDLIMAYASGVADFDSHPKLQVAGLDVALNAEFLELTPLGRAEWAKYIALFFNAEADANRWYADVSARYADLVTLAQTAATRPTVITQTPYEGVWYLPGGGSFASNSLRDAGAAYLWADDPGTGSLPLDVESVFERALNVDYWLDTGYLGSRDALLAADARFAELAAFVNGNVYNNDARVNPNGGFDYYESGPFRPDLVLADLVAIFHPELLPDHEFVYYRPVE